MVLALDPFATQLYQRKKRQRTLDAMKVDKPETGSLQMPSYQGTPEHPRSTRSGTEPEPSSSAPAPGQSKATFKDEGRREHKVSKLEKWLKKARQKQQPEEDDPE